VDEFASALDTLEITPSTYVVLVTRAHTFDVHALRRIVGKPAGYIGMIGSRRRVYAVFKLLREEHEGAGNIDVVGNRKLNLLSKRKGLTGRCEFHRNL